MGNNVSVTSHLLTRDMDRIITIFGCQNDKDSNFWRVLLAHMIDWYVTMLSIARTPMGKARMKASISVSSKEQQEVLIKIHENLFNP